MNNQEPKPEREGLNILYVEDKPTNQKVFALMFESRGCNVDFADNGQEGVEMAEKKRYDVIFMDLKMPVMDGITAAKIINEKDDHPPPIIALTAYYDGIDRSEVIANGIVDIIHKPFSFQDILNKVVYWVQEK